MRYLFCSPVTPDYLHPLVGLALELRRRNHDVAFVTGQAAAPLLEDLAIPLLTRGGREDETFRLQPWPVPEFVAGEVQQLKHALGEVIPDVLIATEIAVSALVVHEQERVPLCLMSAAEDIGLGPETMRLLNDVRGAFGLPATRARAARFPITGDLFLFRSVPALESAPEALPPEVRFVGACEWEPAVEAERTTAALAELDAAAGTRLYVYTHRRSLHEPNLWPYVVKAFASRAVQVVATIAPWDYDPRSVPSHFVIWNSVPRAVVLPRVDLAICTPKTAAALVALAHGLPSLLVAAPRWEGGEHAARMLRAGCATRIEAATLTPAGLRTAVEDALRNDALRRSARRIGAAFDRLPGFGAAADSVEGFSVRGRVASSPSSLATVQ